MANRRAFVRSLAAGALGVAARGALGRGTEANARVDTVRDRIWLWGHPAGSHTKTPEQWGIPGASTVEPVAAAEHMGIRNIIMVRYELEPRPPFDTYAAPFAGLDRVVWSIEGGGGDDVDAALALRGMLPNLRGLMMDDYFGRVPRPPMWLAANDPTFPVSLTLSLREPAAVESVEVTQSCWGTGDYLSKDLAIDIRCEEVAGGAWREVASGTLPRVAGATVTIRLPGDKAAALRVRILSTHDTRDAMSCGLTRVKLLSAGRALTEGVTAAADSEYPGHPAGNVLAGDTEGTQSVFSLRSLKELRRKLGAFDPTLDLWVVLYTHELGLGSLSEHLDLCDVVALWTWRADELDRLEAQMDRLEAVAGPKRKVLGLYMWDYGTNSPMPIAAMERQCELGLSWLREGRVDGLIFLASCICDLGLEAVEWSRRWIGQNGAAAL